jgi:hypothetical protein
VVHSYGVPLRRKEKGRTVNRGEKGPETRESPQKVEGESEGTGAHGPLQEMLRIPHSALGGGGYSVAELLRSLRMRTSPYRLSAKFVPREEVCDTYQGTHPQLALGYRRWRRNKLRA